ncbi:MAG TPA: Ger(x)C family spore germination protein [Bacillota bacterium]|nr:Ger(x)C family spore germination protein [Bacillota bacterium]
MGKKLALIVVCTILIATLSSCYDAQEIDHVAHVLVIGVDKGVSNKWRLTLQFSNMKGGSSGDEQETSMGGDGEDGGSQDGYTYVTVDSPSFFTGLDMLNASVPRRLVFTHAGLIVISEELAKDGLLGEYIAPISRFSEIRGSAHMVTTKGSAMDFIKSNAPSIGTTLFKEFQTAITESENTGFLPHSTLNDFYEALLSTQHQPIMTMGAVNHFESFQEQGTKWDNEFKPGGEYLAGQLPRYGQNKIEYWGTALFNQDKMVGELNGTETRALSMIRGEFKRGFFTIQDPKEPELIIPLDIQQAKKPRINISFDEDTPVIELTLYLKGNILAIQSRLHYEEDPLLSLLEDTFIEDVENRVNQLINKCKSLNIDVFRFGDVAARQFWTIDAWEEYNWNRHFEDAKVTTHIDFSIKKTGTRIKSFPLAEPEESE